MTRHGPSRNGPEEPTEQGSLKIVLCDFEKAGTLCDELRRIIADANDMEGSSVETVAGRELKPDFLAARTEGGHPVIVFHVLGSEPIEEVKRHLETLLPAPMSCTLIGVCGRMEASTREELHRLGLSDFVTTPLNPEDVRTRILWQFDRLKDRSKAMAAVKERLGLRHIIGESPAIRRQIERVPALARCSATVLITGETGTGKEVFARAIHHLGPRSGRSFVPINCGAIPLELVENELFGHEPGAYTSAPTRQTGLLLEAHGGTLFQDEVETLPLSAQVKLLRFLQDKEFRPLGGSKSRQVDVRVIAATNVNLEAAIQAGRFRQDLYYRLDVLSLALPPLRERREDVPLFARYFIQKYAAEFDRPARSIAPEAILKLLSHSWPGNIREMENVMQRAVLQNESGTVEAHEIALPEAGTARTDASFQALKARAVAEFERNYLSTLLREHQGNVSAAAREAQKDRRAFWELLRKHHLSNPRGL